MVAGIVSPDIPEVKKEVRKQRRKGECVELCQQMG